jgi:hypothetical protein
VEVGDDANRSGYLKFLDNCVVLSVKEGIIEEEEIIDNLKKLFHPNWHWQFMEVEEFKYLARFPPQKQVVATFIFDITYFKMKDGVLVSHRAWNGEIDPYDALE